MSTYEVTVTRGEKMWHVYVEMATSEGARRYVKDMLSDEHTHVNSGVLVNNGSIEDRPAEQFATIYMRDGAPHISKPLPKHDAIKAVDSNPDVIGIVRRIIDNWMPWRGGQSD